MALLYRAALLGLATGGRSSVGIAAIALTAPDTGSWLTRSLTRRIASAAALAELVGDKLPATPTRLQPQGLVPRVVLGGLSAGILAHREGNSRPVSAGAAVTGAAGALAGSVLGVRLRSLAVQRLRRDWPTAVVEDLGSVALARYAAGRRPVAA